MAQTNNILATLKAEAKREQLISEYNSLSERRSENVKSLNEGKIDSEEFIETSDAIDRLFKNWRARARRFAMNKFYSTSDKSDPDYEYNEKVTKRCLANSDEIDLYYIHIKR